MDKADILAQVTEATGQGQPIDIQGGNTKCFFGRSAVGEPLDISAYAGIIEHDPAELVVTTCAGTRVTDLQNALAEHRQMLPFSPPCFGPAGTVGGMVAAGLSGPSRPWSGSVRDYVLGSEIVNGRGEHLKLGGRVMKNVAGYDASRLMTGAMGTLGVILEVSLKVLPAPEVMTTRVFECDESAAIEQAAEYAQTALPLAACCYVNGRLHVRLAGSRQGVDAGLELIGGDSLDDETGFWDSVRDLTHPFFDSERPLWRVSLPPATPPLAVPGGFVDWGGAQRWYAAQREEIEPLMQQVQQAGGYVSQFRGGDRTADVNARLDPVIWRLHKQVKQAFDPAGILNPGRLYAGI